MAISLADVKRNVMGPPRLVIYGVPGVGKTTLAACAPGAIWIPVEDGLAGLSVDTMPQPKSYEDLLETIGVLVNEEHSYQTVVIDSLSAIEPMVSSYVCRTVPTDKGATVKHLEGYGFGKGAKTHVPNEWRNLREGLDALRSKGLQIIMLAHSTVVQANDPGADAYDRYQVAIHKDSEPVIYDWADAVLFLNYKTSTVDRDGSDRKRGVGSGERRIYTQERPAFRAKNRYRMPFEMAIADGNPQATWDAIEQCIAAAASPVVAAAV